MFHGTASFTAASGTSWFDLYAAVGVPVVLVLMGLALCWYSGWERRHSPR
jgi:hypothetical protein